MERQKLKYQKELLTAIRKRCLLVYDVSENEIKELYKLPSNSRSEKHRAVIGCVCDFAKSYTSLTDKDIAFSFNITPQELQRYTKTYLRLIQENPEYSDSHKRLSHNLFSLFSTGEIDMQYLYYIAKRNQTTEYIRVRKGGTEILHICVSSDEISLDVEHSIDCDLVLNSKIYDTVKQVDKEIIRKKLQKKLTSFIAFLI